MSRSKSQRRAASDFYSRGHAVASLKIKTFTGKNSGSTRRGESSFMSARPCSRFAENKRRQTPFRVAAAFISSPSRLLFASPPPSFVRPSVRPFVERGGIYITYLPPGSDMKRNIACFRLARYSIDFQLLSNGDPSRSRIKCARSVGHETNTAPGI